MGQYFSVFTETIAVGESATYPNKPLNQPAFQIEFWKVVDKKINEYFIGQADSTNPQSDNIPYSRFYLQGPNFCEIYEVLTSSQILILQLLCCHQLVPIKPREPATEHVILVPGKQQTRYVSYYCHAFICNNGKRIMAISCVHR